MNPAAVAKWLNVAPDTIRRWTKDYKDYLTADARPGQGRTRAFADHDLAVLIFIAALFVPGAWLTTVMAASFVVLGLAYGAFGYATARLNHRVEIDPVTGAETVGQTPRARRSRRSRRR